MWHVFLTGRSKLNIMKKLALSIYAAFFSAMVAMAQEGGKDINVNVGTKDSAWYTSPWVWIVGAAVFILLLVALTRGGRRAD
jgi:hypothetical protein